VRVAEARVGCVVKDRADAIVEDLTVVRSETAVALYEKKPSFGPARARFRNLVAVDVGAFAILDDGVEARFEDAVRIGDAEPPMRRFDGVENAVRPGLAALPPDALFTLAAAARAADASSPGPAALGSLTGSRAGAGEP
jgi:hypothetical protein